MPIEIFLRNISLNTLKVLEYLPDWNEFTKIKTFINDKEVYLAK